MMDRGTVPNMLNSILILLESCLQTCMIYTIAEYTANNSWWWTEELSETSRVSFQNKFEKLVHLVGFIIKKLGRPLQAYPKLRVGKSHHSIWDLEFSWVGEGREWMLKLPYSLIDHEIYLMLIIISVHRRKWVSVTRAWRVFRLRISRYGRQLRIRWIKSRTADSGWFSSRS
jgi:hypothetical protein